MRPGGRGGGGLLPDMAPLTGYDFFPLHPTGGYIISRESVLIINRVLPSRLI